MNMNDFNANKSISKLNIDSQHTPVELLSITEKTSKSVVIDTSFKSSVGINIIELRKVLSQLNDTKLTSALYNDLLQTKANKEVSWENNITAF
jgi:hypothetical protein